MTCPSPRQKPSVGAELALESGKGTEDVEHQPATGGARVDRLSEAHQGDVLLLEVVYDVDQVAQRPSQPIQPPHDQAVTRSGALQRTPQTRTVPDPPGGMEDEAAVHTGLPGSPV